MDSAQPRADDPLLGHALLDEHRLVREGRPIAAVANVLLPCVLGVVLAIVGIGLGRALMGRALG